MSARHLALLLSVAVAATLACSKTQDTAPERRIFGEPPVIQSVNTNFAVQDARAECDFTAVAYGLFCGLGGFSDVELQAGTGWTLVEDPVDHKPVVVHSDTPTSTPGVFINGDYTKFTFEVQAMDPNSTTGNNNILLVSSSFIAPESKIESSLVLFDDGSENQFPITQSSIIFEDCAADPCVCAQARYNITSGDEDKDNSLYTREFIVLNRTAPPFLTDCIMRELNVVGTTAKPHSRYEFKIEAVDRQGNLAVWPNNLVAETGDGRFACDGDSCACCMMHYQSQLTDLCSCLDEPGVLIPSQFPNGFCIDYLSVPSDQGGPGCTH